jgi:hypothetical protein
MRVLGLALGLAMFGSTASAIAIDPQNYTFNFTGTCEVDCVGTATGVLQLENYVLGELFSSTHFVSFSYSGPGLIQFEILADDTGLDVEGRIFGDGTGAAFIANTAHSFFSDLNGFWCVDNSGFCDLEFNADAGIDAQWIAADTSRTPEPGTFALVGVGLAGLWFRRRLLSATVRTS